MSRSANVFLVFLCLALPASVRAQQTAGLRAGVVSVAVQQDTTLPPRRSLFAPPPPQQAGIAARYIGLMSGLGAVALAASNDSHTCPGCGPGLAAIGSIIGSGVGATMTVSALHCERDNARARRAAAGLVAASAALLGMRGPGSTGQWTAVVAFPVATTYFVGGCEQH